jgi:hypothetical protein
MTQPCSNCGAENPGQGNFCTTCGTPIERVESKEEVASDRFKTWVAVLIAIVSIAGAALAYRITIASGNAADADVSGIVSSVNIHQARVASEADLYRDLQAYLQVRIHDQIGGSLIDERDLYPDQDPSQDQLWDEGWTETYVAESYLDQIDLRPEYLNPDGSYDIQAYLDIQAAERALAADLNREGHFAEADRLRSKVQLLVGVALLLGVTLFFYTLAEITDHGIKWLFLILGTGFFAIAIGCGVVIELVMA